MRYQRITNTLVCVVCTLALTLGMGGMTLAFADDSAQEQETSSISMFEEASKSYLEAEEELKTIEGKIAENEARQAELEERLPVQRTRTAACVKAMYLFQQSSPGLLDLILSAEDFNDFISTIRYIDVIQQRNTAEINALVDLENELVQTQAELSAQRDAATQKRDEADAAMQHASSALRQARAAQRVLQASGDVAAQQAAAAQESPATAQENDERQPSEQQEQSEQEQPGTAEQPSSSEQEQTSPQAEQPAAQEPAAQEPAAQEPAPEPEPAAQPQTQESSSTEDWAARIDAYLEGTELAGHGADFAAAAEQYGVDPRISPAISRVESGSGAVCFKPHNAWGWGTQSWGDWTSAIYGHVEGFSEGYGSTLTLEGAQWYAGTSAYAQWYDIVQSEMDQI